MFGPRSAPLAATLLVTATCVATALLSTPATSGAGPLALQPFRTASAERPGRSAGWPGWSSQNWSGYALAGGPFASITAQWRVPAVRWRGADAYSATWAGIDGFRNDGLIQAGTEQDVVRGRASYRAWWTTSSYGYVEQPLDDISVHPGDDMALYIGRTALNLWEITLVDRTQGTQQSVRTIYGGPLTSAEWIMEAPTLNGHVTRLADYGWPVPFGPAAVNGEQLDLASDLAGRLLQGAGVVSAPSLPDSGGFTVTYR